MTDHVESRCGVCRALWWGPSNSTCPLSDDASRGKHLVAALESIAASLVQVVLTNAARQGGPR